MNKILSLSEVIDKDCRDIENYLNSEVPIRGMPTGYKELDKLTDGFQCGQLIAISGDAEDFSLSMLLRCSVIYNIHVGFLHLKPTKLAEPIFEIYYQQKLSDFRNSSKENQGVFWRFKYPTLRNKEIPFYAQYLPDYYNGRSFEMLRQSIYDMYREKGCQCVCINALQYMQFLDKSGMNQGESEGHRIVYELKKLAAELNIPIILLTQTNIPIENSDDPLCVRFGRQDGDDGACVDVADVLIRVDNPSSYYVFEDVKGNDLSGMLQIRVDKSPIKKSGVFYLRNTSRYVGELDDYTPLWRLANPEVGDDEQLKKEYVEWKKNVVCPF